VLSTCFRVDVIVCVDGNFTQKRRKNPKGGGRGPADIHPDTVFLSESQVRAMEDLVEEIRPSRSTVRKTAASSFKAPAEDGYEPSMKVPTSVLDGCHESFTAADSKRVKASTQFFTDTGLMALLCRHDCVLWLVNMTSPGERQHYALALIVQLFAHLPPHMTVGLLYDIGCQLHRSCVKWNFLDDEILSRLIIGISVFHAFGHQWACQLIYHPRKCLGFGLTDGEGCERFWSMIKLLIPALRVSGYYQRLYTLDNQVEFLHQKSMLGLGSWLLRKWLKCQEKKASALAILEDVNISNNELRAQWSAQVAEQTKPLAKQSKNSGSKAVEEILNLISARNSFREDLAAVELMLASGTYEADETDDLIERKGSINKNLEKTQASIQRKRNMLGIDGRANLNKLKDNKFLQLRMNAAALKNRIRTRLRERKFELDRLERAYRQTTSSEKKLHSHIKTSVKRHEPGVVQLAVKYNKLCDEMTKLKNSGAATARGVVPAKIDRAGLFKLDVDDEIWQDVGLEQDDLTTEVPAWLGDEKTRRGIKALLELDRCIEEEQRLALERCSLQEWMMEEWHCVSVALQAENNPDMLYQLTQQKYHLCQLYALWNSKVQQLPARHMMPNLWGPSEEDLQMLEIENNAGLDDIAEEAVSDEEDDSELDGEDEELIEAIELSVLADTYRDEESLLQTEAVHDDMMGSMVLSASALQLAGTPGPSRDSSPKKRSRPNDM